MTKKNRKNMVAYIRSCVEDYEERVQRALDVMDAVRRPLRMASPLLYSQMDDAAREWAEENGVRLGVEFDVEDLIWDEL